LKNFIKKAKIHLFYTEYVVLASFYDSK